MRRRGRRRLSLVQRAVVREGKGQCHSLTVSEAGESFLYVQAVSGRDSGSINFFLGDAEQRADTVPCCAPVIADSKGSTRKDSHAS